MAERLFAFAIPLGRSGDRSALFFGKKIQLQASGKQFFLNAMNPPGPAHPAVAADQRVAIERRGALGDGVVERERTRAPVRAGREQDEERERQDR